MKVVALRGVCIGPGRHLVPGETADMDTAMYTFLSGIKAVEKVEEPAAVVEDAAPSESAQQSEGSGSESGQDKQTEGAGSEAGKGQDEQPTTGTGEGSGDRKSGKKGK